MSSPLGYSEVVKVEPVLQVYLFHLFSHPFLPLQSVVTSRWVNGRVYYRNQQKANKKLMGLTVSTDEKEVRFVSFR